VSQVRRFVLVAATAAAIFLIATVAYTSLKLLANGRVITVVTEVPVGTVQPAGSAPFLHSEPYYPAIFYLLAAFLLFAGLVFKKF
jgi:hypothetical protein